MVAGLRVRDTVSAPSRHQDLGKIKASKPAEAEREPFYTSH
jgi:hypothetical protein